VECFRVEVPFYMGWEWGSGSGEGWLNGRSHGGGGEWRLRSLKLGLKGDNYCGVMEEGRGLQVGRTRHPGHGDVRPATAVAVLRWWEEEEGEGGF
jgi:hypothetical protein